MEEADPQKQLRVGTGSSILRKPFSDLTNLIPKPHHHSTPFSQSKKPITRSSIQRKPFSNLTNLIPKPHHHSTSFSQSKKPVASADPSMAVSSTGATQIHSLVQHQFTVPRDQHPTPTPRTPSPVALNVANTQKIRYDSVCDGKHIAYSGRSQTIMKTRSKTKTTAMPVYPIHLENTPNNTKGIPDPMSHFTGKMKDISNETSMPPKYPPNNKKRCRSSKGSSKKFVLPQDFIDQQRAYFKEVDEYELEVEEADEESA